MALGLQEHDPSLLGIAARFARALLHHRRFNEAGAEGFHLFPGGRPHVTHLDQSTEPAGCGHRLKACHAGPKHHHLGWLNRAGGSHQHGNEPIQGRCGLEGGLVSGDVGLGGEGIHGLGPADTGQQLQGDGRELALQQGADQVPVGKGIQQAHHQGAWLKLGQARPSSGLGGLDGQEHIGPGPAIGCLARGAIEERGPGVAIGAIRVTGGLAGPLLHLHAATEADQPFHRFRCGRDPRFPGPPFAGN